MRKIKVKVKSKSVNLHVDLKFVSTDELLNEIAKRRGIQEIEVGQLYRGYDIIHKYHDEPKRYIIADRAFLLNPRYR